MDKVARLDDEIARLERELAQSDASDDDSELSTDDSADDNGCNGAEEEEIWDTDVDGGDRSEPRKRVVKETGGGQDESVELGQDVEDDDDRIAPLPAQMLPEFYASKKMKKRSAAQAIGAGRAAPGDNRKRRKKHEDSPSPSSRVKAATSTNAKVPGPNGERRCELCSMSFFSAEAIRRHRQSEMHRQAIVRDAMKAYEPQQHRALFCRACTQQFEDEPSFSAHRATEEHKRAVDRERKLSFCKVCRKQFTSVIQLEEHFKGRAHKERLDRLRAR